MGCVVVSTCYGSCVLKCSVLGFAYLEEIDACHKLLNRVCFYLN